MALVNEPLPSGFPRFLRASPDLTLDILCNFELQGAEGLLVNAPLEKRGRTRESLPQQIQELPDPFVRPGGTDHGLPHRVEATMRRNSGLMSHSSQL